MHFLGVNVTFYGAVNMIHDVIKTDYLLPYTATFMCCRSYKKRKSTNYRLKDRQNIYVHSVAVYLKISNSVGRNDNF